MKVRDLDPIGVAKPYLEVHPDVQAVFSDPDWISPKNEPPYPHLIMLDTPGGQDFNRRWLIAPELTLKMLADLDGNPSKKALRDAMGVVLDALRDLPEAPTTPGAAVVTAVRFPGALGYVEEPNGQQAYLARVQLFMHPARKPAATP